MADQDQLKALRLRIDSLDEKLLELISERARCAQDVARVKTQTLGEGEAPVFYRPEREAWVLKHIMQLNNRTTRASSGWRCRATPTRPSG